jgi:hypothetical protein
MHLCASMRKGVRVRARASDLHLLCARQQGAKIGCTGGRALVSCRAISGSSRYSVAVQALAAAAFAEPRDLAYLAAGGAQMRHTQPARPDKLRPNTAFPQSWGPALAADTERRELRADTGLRTLGRVKHTHTHRHRHRHTHTRTRTHAHTHTHARTLRHASSTRPARYIYIYKRAAGMGRRSAQISSTSMVV